MTPVLRTLALLGAALALATPAHADVDGKTTSNQTIQMESVALPVIVNGQLLNYVFVSIRLELMPRADGALVRGKEQFFRDDLVRTGHRAPFTRFDDYTKVDEAKVRAEILRAAPGIVGAGVVKTAVITKQVSQKMLGVPRTATKTAPDIIP
jgi:hypothetical protein